MSIISRQKDGFGRLRLRVAEVVIFYCGSLATLQHGLGRVEYFKKLIQLSEYSVAI